MKRDSERRLAAIVVADVVGYSRLMGADESGVLDALICHRTDFIEPIVDDHRGRIVKTMGDGLLLEFQSVVAAVECAVAVQNGMIERNSGLPDDRTIRFRIGIHVGDVIVEGGDIFGDGVNIASRIEHFANPEGIVISNEAYMQVRDRLSASWEPGGKQQLKNIVRPVQLWHWVNSNTKDRRQDDQTRSSGEQFAIKPSIAVLPLSDTSQDRTNSFLASGISEGITNELARFPELSVAAHRSTLKYDLSEQNATQIGSELGAHYLLTGTLQRSGDRLRVSVQLIAVPLSNIVHSQTYNKRIEDLLDVQDDIARSIAMRIGAVIAFQPPPSGELAEASSLRYHILARKAFRRLTREGNLEALRLNTQAVEADSDSPFGHIGLCFVYAQGYITGWIDVDRDEAKARARDAARRALELDPNNYDSHFAAAWMHSAFGEHAKSIARYNRALELNPSAGNVLSNLAEEFIFSGSYDEAIALLKRGMQSDPDHPTWWHHCMAWAEYFSGNIDAAQYSILRTTEESPDVCLKLAAIHEKMRDHEQAKSAIEKALSQDRDLTVTRLRREFAHRFADRTAFEDWLSTLNASGLPE